VSLKAWRGLGARDAGRVDLRVARDGKVSFIEVNPLAGLHPQHSDLPIICTMVGITFQQLIERILASAIRRVRI
jgi:D-alanine-D-alanine ligase